MTVPRLFAVLFIVVASSVAWALLGASVVHRTGESSHELRSEVAQLWGGRHVQTAPTAWYEQSREVTEEMAVPDATGQVVTRTVKRTVVERVPVPLTESRIVADLSLAHRRKGLLWFDTYEVDYEAHHRLENPSPLPRTVFVQHTFPSSEAVYDGFRFLIAGQQAPIASEIASGVVESISLDPGQEAPITIAYRSRGLDQWSYALAEYGVAQARSLHLTMNTDFRGIDFPPGGMSPTQKEPTPDGWRLTWSFESVVTGQQIALDLPNKLNPGPVVSRITFFAPVSLLFFLTVMVVLGILEGRSLHPMNYFFIAAAFFSFHLLLAYLADQVRIQTAFAASAAVSITLVVTYLRLVAGWRLALLRAGLAQLVYLVLFSATFFLDGTTGLAITVGAILTLFVLMQLTAKVEWNGVFSRDRLGVVAEAH